MTAALLERLTHRYIFEMNGDRFWARMTSGEKKG